MRQSLITSSVGGNARWPPASCSRQLRCHSTHCCPLVSLIVMVVCRHVLLGLSHCAVGCSGCGSNLGGWQDGCAEYSCRTVFSFWRDPWWQAQESTNTWHLAGCMHAHMCVHRGASKSRAALCGLTFNMCCRKWLLWYYKRCS